MEKKPAVAYDVVNRDFRLLDPEALRPSLLALRQMARIEFGLTDMVDGGFPLRWATYVLFGTFEDEAQNKASGILWRLEHEAKVLEAKIILRHDETHRWYERFWFFKQVSLEIVRKGAKRTPPPTPPTPTKPHREPLIRLKTKKKKMIRRYHYDGGPLEEMEAREALRGNPPTKPAA